MAQITFLGATARQTARREADFDSSAAFGIRARWFLEEPAWFGFALGVGYYQADGESVDIDVIPFSGLLMVRRPSPEGFEPYAGLGLTYAYADVDLEFFPELPAQVSGSANGIGPDLFRKGRHLDRFSRTGRTAKMAHRAAQARIDILYPSFRYSFEGLRL